MALGSQGLSPGLVELLTGSPGTWLLLWPQLRCTLRLQLQTRSPPHRRESPGFQAVCLGSLLKQEHACVYPLGSACLCGFQKFVCVNSRRVKCKPLYGQQPAADTPGCPEAAQQRSTCLFGGWWGPQPGVLGSGLLRVPRATTLASCCGPCRTSQLQADSQRPWRLFSALPWSSRVHPPITLGLLFRRLGGHSVPPRLL